MGSRVTGVDRLPRTPSSIRSLGAAISGFFHGVRRASGERTLPQASRASATQRRELLARAEDPEHMLAVFRRELPALTDADLRITSCSVKPSSWRKSVRKERLHLVYTLEIEAGGAPRGETVLLGIAPVTPDVLDAGWKDGNASAHPWTAPFRKSSAYIAELQMAVLLFPLDPSMPALAEITGSAGAGLLEPWLPECRAGARIAALACELVHYKPFDRAVLRIRLTLRGPGSAECQRTVYAKFFADESGAECSGNLEKLWSATSGATSLRLPEPLGYDPARAMMLMREAPGERDLTAWIRCIERDEPLPDGVGGERLERCALVSARALRELQRTGVRPELRRPFRFELARMKKDSGLLLGAVQERRRELADRAVTLLARLERLAPASERLVPAHGAFRHKQMLGNELALTVIDWDGLCLANPALDAAAFLGRLRQAPVRRPGAAPELERMAAVFRSTFLEDQPEVTRDLDLYQGLELTEQLLRSFRRPGFDDETAGELRSLADAASGMLDRVESARVTVPRSNALARWLPRAAAVFAFDLFNTLARIARGL